MKLLFLDDGDVRLYLGDALETVRTLPDESVDCVVTSPPYWGLRDYGTGEWDGGDPDCDHQGSAQPQARDKLPPSLADGPKPGMHGDLFTRSRANPSRECQKCGARRVDRQMGLEPTPDLFVQNMVELFREIRRVLAPHGTCWVNLGDSYAGGGQAQPQTKDVLPPSLADGPKAGMHGELFTKSRTGNVAVPGLKQKDLVGIPWRVAFALQADGWWLRSDIIWAKPNPMPESVTDRPTKAHEYVFLLTKQPRYWFDQEAVREAFSEVSLRDARLTNGQAKRTRNSGGRTDGYTVASGTVGDAVRGRNIRSVWEIATQPYPEAHFATFPEKLARRAVLSGCPARVCRVCGVPSERQVEKGEHEQHHARWGDKSAQQFTSAEGDYAYSPTLGRERDITTVGWSDCGHNNWRPGLVLDPFIGSGTTAKVARDHQRHAIGIDLNETYLELAARRLQQLSLLNEAS